MALHYVCLFGGTGVSLPFAGLWFRAQGLSGADIGILLAAPMLGRLITGPAVAVWADGFRYRRTALAILAVVAAAAYGATGLVQGLWLWGPLWFLGATAAAAMIPLADAMTMRLARREGFSFAIPRGFGSAAFVAANILMGAVLTGVGVDAVILWIVAASALAAVGATWLLPPETVEDGPPVARMERFRGLGRLVIDPAFMTAILAVGCIQATHAFYYGFSAIAWKAQGLPESLTGLLWAFSVLVEIGVMWWLEPWRRRAGIGAWAVLGVGAAAAMVRWTALAFAPPLWALWPLQALHGLTFAATYLAGVEIADRLSPPNGKTSAQTLNSMLASGVLMGLATLAAGPLYDAAGVGGYLAMTALAVLGGGLAFMGSRRRPARSAV